MFEYASYFILNLLNNLNNRISKYKDRKILNRKKLLGRDEYIDAFDYY